MSRRIYRSRKESMIAGVCGGLGEYFDLDPVLMRIIFVLLAFAGGAGVIGYILAWIIIPEAPQDSTTSSTPAAGHNPSSLQSTAGPEESKEKRTLLGGLVLIAIGIIFLFSNLFHWFRFWEMWPVILIVIGALIIMKAKREKNENSASA